jgi:hypothetical protein
MDLIDKNIKPSEESVLNEPTADYEKASTDLLREALKRSYTERFLMTTRLYKIQSTLNNAKITHHQYTPDK